MRVTKQTETKYSATCQEGDWFSEGTEAVATAPEHSKQTGHVTVATILTTTTYTPAA